MNIKYECHLNTPTDKPKWKPQRLSNASIVIKSLKQLTASLSRCKLELKQEIELNHSLKLQLATAKEEIDILSQKKKQL
jgi:hypothetical protein